MRSLVRGRSARVLLAGAALGVGAGCGPAVLPLYPVTGDTFALALPPRAPADALGPFEGDDEARFERLVARWRDRLDDRDAPGGAIAVVIDGRLRFSAGVGAQELGSHAPVTAATRFRTASITKMIIAATILSLVDEGRLDLDGAVVDHVPAFTRGPGFDASAVTLEMLLTHTSGIPDSVYCPDGASLDETFDAHSSDPYWAPPGRLYDYSNANYALLAAVIARSEGRAFQDVVRDRVFVPAGMSSASFAAEESEADLARGHVGGEVVWRRPVECDAGQAAGGVIASAIDFAHFAEALLGGGRGVLSPASVEAMTTGRARMQTAPLERYGYGVVEREHAGLRTIEHAGSGHGFSTIVRFVPERGFAVVVLTNGTAPPDGVADAAIAAFLGVPEAAAPRFPALASALGEYVGTYDDPFGALGRFAVVDEGGVLGARLESPRGPIAGGLRATFERDASGRIEYLVTRAGIARRVR